MKKGRTYYTVFCIAVTWKISIAYDHKTHISITDLKWNNGLDALFIITVCCKFVPLQELYLFGLVAFGENIQ